MTTRAETRCFLVSKDVVVPLSSGSPVVLGRDAATCNFVLSDERVSRVHAMVVFRDNEYFVKDLNSSNGTIVNDRKITGPAKLHPGDLISIPPFTLEFVRPDYAQGGDGPEGSPLSQIELRNKLEGSIATLPITDLIQLLNATMQSGVLTITDKDEHQADLIFEDGEISQAHYNGKSGEQAVYALIRVREGRFEFAKTERFPLQQRMRSQPGAAEKPEGERQIHRRTQSLLLEGARLMDENHPATRMLKDKTAKPLDPKSIDIEFLGTVTD